MKFLWVDLVGGLMTFCITSVSGQYYTTGGSTTGGSTTGGSLTTSFYYNYYDDDDNSVYSTIPAPSPIFSSSSTRPSSPTPFSSSTPSSDSVCEGLESDAGDGYCDDFNNSLACDWDGGDCCLCTCEESDFSCVTFECLDPDAPTDCEADSSAESDSSSTRSTTATDTSLSGLAITGIVVASFTGYCLLGGLLTLAVTSILRKRREKMRCAKITNTEVV